MEGIRRGERGIYVALSESEHELRDIAASHAWDLSQIDIVEIHSSEASLQADAQYTFFHPSEVELSETTQLILDAVERVDPARIVFDSLSEMRLLARDSLRYRRQLLALKHYFGERGCTVMLLDVQEGDHDYRIVRGGLEVYPRLVAAAHRREEPREPLSSSVPGLDALLGGGLERGATTVLLGPAGVGKSTVSTLFVHSALAAGERAAVFLFDETPYNWKKRNRGLGLDLETWIEDGRLQLRLVDPAQVSPGELAHALRRAVLEEGVSVTLLDSINGCRYAMPQEDALTLHLHELFTFLNQQGVVTLVVMGQHAFLGETETQPLHISYLADTVMLLRYFEALGTLRKSVSVVKKSTGNHERAIRELLIGPNGVEVGEALRDFRGVMSGELRYQGRSSPLMEPRE